MEIAAFFLRVFATISLFTFLLWDRYEHPVWLPDDRDGMMLIALWFMLLYIDTRLEIVRKEEK